MVHSAGRSGGLDLIVLLETLQPLPQVRASAEQDRDHHDVHVAHKPRREEVADHGGASTEAFPSWSTATTSLVPQSENHRRQSCHRGDSPIPRPLTRTRVSPIDDSCGTTLPFL